MLQAKTTAPISTEPNLTEPNYRRKTAIIGAGFCGLGVTGALERHNIAYDCLEADDQIGGNWYHGVYETVHIISSRKTTAYREYPMPESYPDFPSASQMLAYLNDYADLFGIRQHIQLNRQVELVAPAPNDGWEITLASGEKRVYGAVVIANGHHWHKRMPTYPGQFAGQIIHSKDYKNSKILAGKRVLVIGGGNSACDVAVEAARFATSSHISMRRGYWIIPKTLMGVPLFEHTRRWLPLRLQQLYLRALLAVAVGPYEKYGLQKPDHTPYEHHPTINSELLYFLRQGLIQPHSDVARYNGSRVEFTDGTSAEFDLIVAATGYDLSLPILAPGLVDLIIPANLLATAQIVQFSRFMRSETLEVLGQDYVRTASAKGLGPAVINRRHVLPNALIPVVTLLGGFLSSIFSGAIIIAANRHQSDGQQPRLASLSDRASDQTVRYGPGSDRRLSLSRPRRRKVFLHQRRRFQHGGLYRATH